MNALVTPQNVDRLIEMGRRFLKAGASPHDMRDLVEACQRFWPDEPINNIVFTKTGARLKEQATT